MSAAWNKGTWDKTMVMPRSMKEPGTMLVNGLPCPTHHTVDEETGFFVCMGSLFWSRVLEVLSSRLTTSSATLSPKSDYLWSQQASDSGLSVAVQCVSRYCRIACVHA